MATYIMLGNFTDQGIRNVRETTKRVQEFKEMAKKAGVTVKDFFGKVKVKYDGDTT